MSDFSLIHLPDEILLEILKYFHGNNIVVLTKVSHTCKRLNNLILGDDLWKYFSNKDYNVTNIGEWPSYRELYTNLLHQHGAMLGVYQTILEPYNGLMEVTYLEGKIIGREWLPGKVPEDPLCVGNNIFLISTRKNISCYDCPSMPEHTCSITHCKITGTITQKCSSGDKHKRWLSNIPDNDDMPMWTSRPSLLCEKIITGIEYKHLKLPTSQDIPASMLDDRSLSGIITPGLFTGSYGGHGVELIMFNFMNDYEIHGLKVTGDPNVFGGKISIKILLKCPMFPSKDEQTSLHELIDIEPNFNIESTHQLPSQPFFLPSDCYSESNDLSLPNLCKARYHGYGQIANTGYSNPRFIAVNVIIFNNDLLGVIFLSLSHLALFHRCKQTFTPTNLKYL